MRLLAIIDPHLNGKGKFFIQGNSAYPLPAGLYAGTLIWEEVINDWPGYCQTLASISNVSLKDMLNHPIKHINCPFFHVVRVPAGDALHWSWLPHIRQDYQQYRKVRAPHQETHQRMANLFSAAYHNDAVIVFQG